MESASSVLAPWANFYILVGSAAGALIGLMFVVITIVMNGRAGSSRVGLAAFSTPTVIHLATVLLVAATLSAPWKILICPAATIALAGVAGTIYLSRLIVIAVRFDDYHADAEDWSWYFVLPLLGYITLIVGAMFLPRASLGALFALGGSALLLIFVAIHNAWDIVTYIATRDTEGAS